MHALLPERKDRRHQLNTDLSQLRVRLNEVYLSMPSIIEVGGKPVTAAPNTMGVRSSSPLGTSLAGLWYNMTRPFTLAAWITDSMRLIEREDP